MGAVPGRIVAMRHAEPAPSSAPRSRAGITPASTSDDLPQPDAPTTARKRGPRRRSSTVAICASRPKNTSASAMPNGRKPMNGLSPAISLRASTKLK